jgi:hypothetical protein
MADNAVFCQRALICAVKAKIVVERQGGEL